eukprot:15366138-Ditylum_brightwellii.AAC.2
MLCKVDWEDTLLNGNVCMKGSEMTFNYRLSHGVESTSPGFSPCDEGNSYNLVYEKPYDVLYDKQSQASQSLGTLPNSKQVLCSVEPMETVENEEGNIDEMVELGAQTLHALSLKPSSSECCLSLLSNEDENKAVVSDRNDQVEFAQMCKEDEGVKVTSNSCISTFKSIS